MQTTGRIFARAWPQLSSVSLEVHPAVAHVRMFINSGPEHFGDDLLNLVDGFEIMGVRRFTSDDPIVAFHGGLPGWI